MCWRAGSRHPGRPGRSRSGSRAVASIAGTAARRTLASVAGGPRDCCRSGRPPGMTGSEGDSGRRLRRSVRQVGRGDVAERGPRRNRHARRGFARQASARRRDGASRPDPGASRGRVVEAPRRVERLGHGIPCVVAESVRSVTGGPPLRAPGWRHPTRCMRRSAALGSSSLPQLVELASSVSISRSS